MKKNYFKGVLGSLKAGRYDKKISHDFVAQELRVLDPHDARLQEHAGCG